MQLIPLLINFTSFAQLQIKDKLRTFPRREGFTRNKEKISNLICFGPFVILSKPSLPGQGQDRPTALLYDPGRLVLAALQQNQKKGMCRPCGFTFLFSFIYFYSLCYFWSRPSWALSRTPVPSKMGMKALSELSLAWTYPSVMPRSSM